MCIHFCEIRSNRNNTKIPRATVYGGNISKSSSVILLSHNAKQVINNNQCKLSVCLLRC